MIYGDSFSISKKSKKWLKIKIKEDGYIGFIKNKKFPEFLKPTHKVSILKSNVFKNPNKREKISEISFGSKIKVTENKKKFLRFSKGWVNKDDVKPISFKETDPFRKISIFKNIKYKWGGKSFKGIDCSALIQVFLNFNNKFCPRDAKDQVKFFKKNVKLKKLKKNDIIYWKGHVALALTSKKLIHAYGPMKKTVVMGVNETIERIEQTARLKVIGIRRL
jgi:cell wall-associated NlpC family hydrolase